MDELLENSYTFELVDSYLGHVKYDFVSNVTHEVPKRVSFRPVYSFPTYYNLGFGDLTIDAEGNEKVNDRAKNINKVDGPKILNTALACSLDFMVTNPDTSVIFFGNNALKHRYYKMLICKDIKNVEEYMTIKGAIIPDYVEMYEDDGFKNDIGAINVETINFEPFNASNCHLYNFITFELKAS